MSSLPPLPPPLFSLGYQQYNQPPVVDLGFEPLPEDPENARIPLDEPDLRSSWDGDFSSSEYEEEEEGRGSSEGPKGGLLRNSTAIELISSNDFRTSFEFLKKLVETSKSAEEAASHTYHLAVVSLYNGDLRGALDKLEALRGNSLAIPPSKVNLLFALTHRGLADSATDGAEMKQQLEKAIHYFRELLTEEEFAEFAAVELPLLLLQKVLAYGSNSAEEMNLSLQSAINLGRGDQLVQLSGRIVALCYRYGSIAENFFAYFPIFKLFKCEQLQNNGEFLFNKLLFDLAFSAKENLKDPARTCRNGKRTISHSFIREAKETLKLEFKSYRQQIIYLQEKFPQMGDRLLALSSRIFDIGDLEALKRADDTVLIDAGTRIHEAIGTCEEFYRDPRELRDLFPIDTFIDTSPVAFALDATGCETPSETSEYHSSLMGAETLSELWGLLKAEDRAKLKNAARNVFDAFFRERRGAAFESLFISRVDTSGRAFSLPIDHEITVNLMQRLINHITDDYERYRDPALSYFYLFLIRQLITHILPLEKSCGGAIPDWLTDLSKHEGPDGISAMAIRLATEPSFASLSRRDYSTPGEIALKKNLLYLQNNFLKMVIDNPELLFADMSREIRHPSPVTISHSIAGNHLLLRGFTLHLDPRTGWPASLQKSWEGKKALAAIIGAELPQREREEMIALSQVETAKFLSHISTKGLSYSDERGARHPLILIPDQNPHLSGGELSLSEELGEVTDDRVGTRVKPEKGGSSFDIQILLADIKLLTLFQKEGFVGALCSRDTDGLEQLQKRLARAQAAIDDKMDLQRSRFSELLAAEENLEEEPFLIGLPGTLELKEYQVEALDRVLRLKARGIQGAILGLDMGLGKTPIMANMIADSFRGKSGPVLFLCPLSITLQNRKKIQGYLVAGQLMQIAKLLNAADSVEKVETLHALFQKMQRSAASLKLDFLSEELNSLEATLKSARESSDSQREKGKRPSLRQKALNSLFNGDPKNNSNCHLLGMKPLSDVTLLEGMQDPSFLEGKRKVVVASIDSLSSKMGGNISRVEWQNLFIDEGQRLHTRTTELHSAALNLVKQLQEKNPLLFVLIATGTPYENKSEEVATLLSLIEPDHPPNGNGELLTIDRLHNTLVHRQKKTNRALRKLFYNLDWDRRDYRIFRKEFISTLLFFENYKRVINELCIVKKRESVREEWGGSIPHIDRLSVDFALDGRFPAQEEILLQLNSDFKDEYLRLQNRLHKLEEELRQRQERDPKRRKVASTSQDLSSEQGGDLSFFEFASKVSRTLIHPGFYPIESREKRMQLAQEIAGWSREEVQRWVGESMLLSHMFSKEFSREMEEGVVIFIKEIAVGKALQSCILRLYDDVDQVEFINGSTPAEDREAMIGRFEAPNPERRKRVLIIMQQSGCAGIDLRNNGKTLFKCFSDFNPGAGRQGEARIVRANSSKERVKIVDYSVKELFFFDCVKRHIKRKELEEKYLFESQSGEEMELPARAMLLMEIFLLMDRSDCAGMGLAPGEREAMLWRKLAKHLQKYTPTLEQAIEEHNPLAHPLRALEDSSTGSR